MERKKYKQVSVYKKQALIIINKGDASQKDIDKFAKMIEKDVKEKTGIKIEREVMFVV